LVGRINGRLGNGKVVVEEVVELIGKGFFVTSSVCDSDNDGKMFRTSPNLRQIHVKKNNVFYNNRSFKRVMRNYNESQFAM